VDGEVLHFIALREEMELEFAQKRKKNIIFKKILEFVFQL
jgi:hypothetical protein